MSSEISNEMSVENDNLQAESDDFLEKLNEYYKLKNEYETKKQVVKNNILKDDTLTMKQKQEKFGKYKLRCVNCNRNVGSIFENNDGILTAICGDKVKPCPLDIKINRGKFLLLEELLDAFQDGVEETKENIIKIKLDLLFNYKKETDVLNEFASLKSQLEEDLEAVMEYKTKLINNVKNLGNKPELKAKLDIFYNKISLIKATISEFSETGQTQLVKDTVEMYVNELKPLLIEIQALKYKYLNVEYNASDNNYKLVRNVYTFSDLIEPFSNPVVERFETSFSSSKVLDGVNDDISVEEIGEIGEIEELETLSVSSGETTHIPSPPSSNDKQVRMINNKLMIGDKVIANKLDYDKNKELYGNIDTIGVTIANNLHYKLEMIYIAENKPELIAVDGDTGAMYRVIV